MWTSLAREILGAVAFGLPLNGQPDKSLLWPRDHREIIRAKRRCRQAVAVEEAAERVIGPAVANGDRVGNFRAAQDYFISLNDRFRIEKLLVFAGDREA